jgi:hypothetical protein
MRPLKNNWMPGIAFIQWASQPVLRYFQVDSRLPLSPAGHGAISQDWLCPGASTGVNYFASSCQLQHQKKMAESTRVGVPAVDWVTGSAVAPPNRYPLDRFVEFVTAVLSDRPRPSVLLCCQMCQMLHAMASEGLQRLEKPTRLHSFHNQNIA